MLNMLWSFMIIFSIIVSFFTGRTAETVNGAMEGASEAVTMCIGLLGMMCMWNGLMKIAELSGITEKVAVIVKPVFKLLFKNISAESAAGKAIIMNITANLLGMGNAATPLGLKAMREMKKECGKECSATKEMIMFTALNTASFQLIPSTLIGMRMAAGSANASEIIIPIWCASACSVATVIICAKLGSK
ncbi:MAG: nucleoside recognition domain-containing protein [Bacillota bacterium]|nr:nucleoside recognition domain-containing protein [Bacillota bacterium]